jgi:hypothetical protein
VSTDEFWNEAFLHEELGVIHKVSILFGVVSWVLMSNLFKQAIEAR